jgi:hypothetical protein
MILSSNMRSIKAGMAVEAHIQEEALSAAAELSIFIAELLPCLAMQL